MGTILLLVFLLRSGIALECYICNSEESNDCIDPFDWNTAFLKNCSQVHETSICFRTTVRNRTTGHTVTTRGCGDCDVDTSISDLNVLHCQMCEVDGCNGASVYVYSDGVAIAPVMFLVLFSFLVQIISKRNN